MKQPTGRQQSKSVISWITLIISFIALAFSIWACLKSEKIVYVDSMKLFSNYKGALNAKAEYEKKLALWKANVDTLTLEFNTEASTYEKEKSKMSSREKKLSEELLTSKGRQLENYRSAISENAAKEDKEITAQIYKEINEFLKRYGETNGYDYILGATNIGNVVYAKTGKDVTDDALNELNSEYQPIKK